MKYAIVLAIIVAVSWLHLTQANKGGKEPVGGISSCIQDAITSNKTLLENVIVAVNDAKLTQYLANDNKTTLNWTLVEQNLFSLLPFIKYWLFENIVPVFLKLNTTINAVLSMIDTLLNNATAQTQLGAFLLFVNYNGNSQFV